MVNPNQPFEAFMSFQKVMFDKITENNKNLLKAIEIMTNPPEVLVGESEAEVVYNINNIKLLHYKPLTKTQEPVPLLIIYALINRPYILDLQPDRSVIRHLLSQGFDVYLIDWDAPREQDHLWNFNDYVNVFIDSIVDHIREHHDLEKISILGYCMGGTLSTIYTALHPDKVKNFITMAAPIYFDTDENLLHIWARPQYFDVDRVVDTLGNIPPEFINGGYMTLDPVGNYYLKYIKFLENVNNEDFVKMFLRMEKWIHDGIPLAGETYRELLKYGYQQNLLVKNEWKVNGETVNLTNITMPYLNIVGLYDNLVPPSAAKPLIDYVGSTDKHELLIPTGHIGLSVSSKSHRDLWPKVADWLRPRSKLQDYQEKETKSTTRSKPASGSRGKGKGKSRGKK